MNAAPSLNGKDEGLVGKDGLQLDYLVKICGSPVGGWLHRKTSSSVAISWEICHLKCG